MHTPCFWRGSLTHWTTRENLIFLQIWNKGNFYINYGPDFYFLKEKNNPLGQNERGKNIIFAFKMGNTVYTGFADDANGKEPTCQYRRHKRCGFSPWVGKTPWRRAWQPLQSSVLAWKIPRTEKPGGLQSIESQRIRHDWSDLAHMHGFYSWEIICIHFLHAYKNW